METKTPPPFLIHGQPLIDCDIDKHTELCRTTRPPMSQNTPFLLYLKMENDIWHLHGSTDTSYVLNTRNNLWLEFYYSTASATSQMLSYSWWNRTCKGFLKAPSITHACQKYSQWLTAPIKSHNTLWANVICITLDQAEFVYWCSTVWH